VEYFKHLGSMITNAAICTRPYEIKTRIAMAKVAFNKKKAFFARKLDLNLRNKQVKCYIRNITLYGAESWTFRKVDQKYLESSGMLCWRMMEKISWTDRVWNEEELNSVKHDRNILLTVKGRVTVLVTSCVGTAFYNTLLN